MYCQDSAVNYLRDAEILISNDLNEWTKVITIGDGIENKNDANVKCIDSDAGYKASSTYPNKVYVEGNVDNIEARYLQLIIIVLLYLMKLLLMMVNMLKFQTIQHLHQT